MQLWNDHEPNLKGAAEIEAWWYNPTSGLREKRARPAVDHDNQTQPNALTETLFTWTWPTPSSLGFTLEIWEDDDSLAFGLGGDDFVGSAYIAFSDANSRAYPAGVATFTLKFKP